MQHSGATNNSNNSFLPIVKTEPSTDPSNVVYTPKMVVTLLELRWVAFRDAFEKHKSTAQRSATWERLSLRFNIVCQCAAPVPTKSLKNKIDSLRREFVKIRLLEKNETGNRTELGLIAYPEYWDDLNSIYGDMEGLGLIEFGAEDPNADTQDNSLNSSIGEDPDFNHDDAVAPDLNAATTSTPTKEDSDSKRKLDIQAEIDRQRKKRKESKQGNLGPSLVEMGTTLAQGLVNAAQLSARPHKDNDDLGAMVKVMQETNDILKATKSSLEQGSLVQAKLLELLESKGL